MSNNLYTVTGNPPAGQFGRSAALRAEFELIAAAFEKIKREAMVFWFADLNTAGSIYLPAPVDGLITTAGVIPSANNATTATVITLSINGSPVTMPALSIALGGLAGALVSVTPTAANAVTRLTSIIRAITDGGGSSVMPGAVILGIERS